MELVYWQVWLPYCQQRWPLPERPAPPAPPLAFLRLWWLAWGSGVSALEAELAALLLWQLEESRDPQSEATCAG